MECAVHRVYVMELNDYQGSHVIQNIKRKLLISTEKCKLKKWNCLFKLAQDKQLSGNCFDGDKLF